MSQPTLSRLENTPDAKVLYKIGRGFIDDFCAGYKTPPASIVLDIDDTNDMAHGQQEFVLFNTPKRLGASSTRPGGHCTQPMLIFEANSGAPLVSLFRPGKRPSGAEIARVLWHTIHRIIRHWPKVRILVRGDGHYCAPEVLNLLRRLHCDYILGLPINFTLKTISNPWKEPCELRRKPSRPKVRRFHQFEYAAGRGRRRRKSSHASRPPLSVRTCVSS